jgi:hypothetical protein
MPNHEATEDLRNYLKDKLSGKWSQFGAGKMPISNEISKALDAGADPRMQIVAKGQSYTLEQILNALKAPKTLEKLHAKLEEIPDPKAKHITPAQANAEMAQLMVNYKDLMYSAHKYSDDSYNREDLANRMVQLVTEFGADPNLPSPEKAAKHGSNYIHKEDKLTPMHYLGAIGAAEQFEKMCKAGGNPNVKNGEGNTPAHLLLTNYYNLKDVDLSQEHIIISRGEVPVERIAKTLNVMLHSGADFTITNDKGETPKDAFFNLVKASACKDRNGSRNLEAEKAMTPEQVTHYLWAGTSEKDCTNHSGLRVTKLAIWNVIDNGLSSPEKVDSLIEGPPKQITTEWKQAVDAEKKAESDKWWQDQKNEIKQGLDNFKGMYKEWKGASNLQVHDADPSQPLQAMTQRDAVQVAAASTAPKLG